MRFGEAALHHAILALAVLALVAAGLRMASAMSLRGLPRCLAATVFAATAAVLQALALGLAGLGGDTAALALAAAASWLAVRRWLPEPDVTVAEELIDWARGLRPVERTLAGGVAGAWAAWAAWLFAYPALGHDMVLYHVPEAIAWVHGGSPGSIEPIVTGLPVGNYPLTHEVLLSWGLALSRGLAWVTLATALAPVLIAAGTWVGLRGLGVGRLHSGLAAGALAATPAVLASQSGGASLDPAALGWLVACAAFCSMAPERPAALLVALPAAGLAVGTKTTAAPLAALVLIIGLAAVRSRLRPLASPLALAAGAAVAVGGYWYLRNLVDHGSPLWPFVAASWGDPSPPIIEGAKTSFLDRPGDTLSRLDSYYLEHFGGPLLLFAAALTAPLVARRREATWAALAASASVLIWLNAPFTGVVGNPIFDAGTGDATRYLLPGVAAAALAVALAARRGGPAAVAATCALTAALGVGLLNTFGLGFPSTPSPWTPAAGAAAGALLALAAGPALARRPPTPRAGVAAGATLAAVALLGAVAASGYVSRHADSAARQSGVAGWLDSQEEWRDGERSVSSSFSLIGPLAGDRLQHRLELLRPAESCELVAARAERGWVVLDRPSAHHPAPRCLDGVAPAYEDDHYRGYVPGTGPGGDRRRPSRATQVTAASTTAGTSPAARKRVDP